MKVIINKWKKMPNSVKSAIVFTISSFIIKGISFLVTPIFTRIMNIDDYGIIVTYNSWLAILDVFAVMSLTSAGVFNVGLNDNSNNRDKFISNCIGLCNFTTLFAFSIIFIVKAFSYGGFLLRTDLLVVMFIHFLFSPAQIFWLTRQKYEYKYKMAALITISSVVVSQIFAVIGVLYIKSDAVLFKTIGHEIGVLIFAIPLYILLLRRGKQYFDFKEWKKILKLAIPLIPHYLAQHIMTNSDRIMISKYVNQAGAAIYGVVSYISLIASIIWNSINASLVPYTFGKLNEKKYDDINKTCQKLLIGCAMICVLVIIIAPEVLSILAPGTYKGGVYAVPPLVFTVFLSALYNLFANVEFYHKKTGNIAIATCVAAVVNLVLNYIFIPKYGYIAAAYTTMISTMVSVGFHYRGYKKSQSETIYNMSFIFILSILLLVFCMFGNLLYLNSVVRYVIILLCVVLIIINKKKIVDLIKTIKNKN